VFNYGRRVASWSYHGSGSHRACARGGEGDPELLLVTDMLLGLEGPMAVARTRLRGGDRRFCALSWSEHPPPEDGEDAAARLTEVFGLDVTNPACWRGIRWVAAGLGLATR